jgi:hypothetical protein
MNNEKLNEDCGCESTSNTIRTHTQGNFKYSTDPLVGKMVSLIDGRKGLVDDAIRNNTGEVIGYVIEGDRGNYRVFKNKISDVLTESGEAFATLPSVPGMGDIKPPMPDGTPGSGDKFSSLSTRKSQVRKNKNKKEPNPFDSSVLDFESFKKKMKEMQLKTDKNT